MVRDGFVSAFWAGAGIAFVGVLVSIFHVRGRDLRVPRGSGAGACFDPIGQAALNDGNEKESVSKRNRYFN